MALKKENITYIACSAEHTTIPNHSVDLTTVAQALHWFDFDAFYQEVHRIIKPNGIIAVWCYSLAHISPSIDILTHKLYENILGDTYWPKERRYIDNQYKTIPFPFSTLSAPSFSTDRLVTLDTWIGYLNTWSAVKEYQQKNHGKNPIDFIIDNLKQIWRNPDKTYCCTTPIHLLVAKI